MIASDGNTGSAKRAGSAFPNHADCVMTGHAACAHAQRCVRCPRARGVPSSENRYLTDEIRSTLERDERLPHPAEVAVLERHDTVRLRGSVGTFHQRRAAVRIARSVYGVVAVDDELWVDPRDRWRDDEIRGAALQALMSNERVPAERIDVAVDDGWDPQGRGRAPI